MENIEVLKGQLRKEFEMKDMGMLKYFLGMQVHRDRANRQIFLHQTSYINSILGKFDMANCNPVTTPMATGTVLYKATEKDKVLEDPREYQSLIGSLMYAMLCTRPDLAYAVSQLSQFNNAPTQTPFQTAKRVLRYLKGTAVSITFIGSDANGLDVLWGNGEKN